MLRANRLLIPFVIVAGVALGQPESPTQGKDLPQKDLIRLWDDLAGTDAVNAYQAIWSLVEVGPQAIRFFEEHLLPAAAADPKKVDRLIKDLYSDGFGIRDKANKELEKLGELADPALERALGSNPPLEVKKRLEKLLSRQLLPTSDPKRLRSIRSVEALEQIRTPEAQKLLQKLARGAPAAQLTQDARETLKRLSKRPTDQMEPAVKRQSRNDSHRDSLPGGASARLGKPRTNDLGFGIAQIIFLLRGNIVATASDDGSIRLWDASNGKLRKTLVHEKAVQAIAQSPDGKLLASSSLDDTVRLWQIETGRQIRKLKGHGPVGGGSLALSFSDDGSRLFSWGRDMVLRVWDTAQGQKLRESKLKTKEINIHEVDKKTALFLMKLIGRAAFTPAEELALAMPGKLHFFDITSGKEKQAWNLDVYRLTFSPANKLALTSNIEQAPNERAFQTKFLVWHSGQLIQTIELKGAWGGLAFSPDGRSFATVGPQFILWEVASGKPRLTVEDLPANGRDAAFSPDARLLVAALEDTTALVWDLTKMPAAMEKKITTTPSSRQSLPGMAAVCHHIWRNLGNPRRKSFEIHRFRF